MMDDNYPRVCKPTDDIIDRLEEIAYYIEYDVIGGDEPARTVKEAIEIIKRARCEGLVSSNMLT